MYLQYSLLVVVYFIRTPDAAEREERLRAIPSANYNYCLQALLKNITTQTEAEELFPAEYAKCMDEYEPIKKAKGLFNTVITFLLYTAEIMSEQTEVETTSP